MDEEVIALATQAGFHVAQTDEGVRIRTGSGDWDTFDVTDKIKALLEAHTNKLAAKTGIVPLEVEAQGLDYCCKPADVRGALATMQARVEQLQFQLKLIRAAIAIKGGDEFSPTQWAYDQACKALDAKTSKLDLSEKENESLRLQNTELDKKLGELEDVAYCLTAILERAGPDANVAKVIQLLEQLHPKEDSETPSKG